jgi:hypothetical protein
MKRFLMLALLAGAPTLPSAAQATFPTVDQECNGTYENGCRWEYYYNARFNNHHMRTNCGNGWVSSTGTGDTGVCNP